MTLEYAAYLLDENFILTEDADGTGVSSAKDWVRKNYHLIDFGQDANDEYIGPTGMPVRFQDRITHEERNMRNIDNVVEAARVFFGHWLGNHLGIPRTANVGVFKYLPGAIRIAITDCGWQTAHPDTKMLENLQYMYAAAYLEWRAGLERTQGYPGKFNKSFNNLSYSQLMRELGDKIPEVKEKFAEIAAAGRQIEEPEGSQEEAVAEPVNQSPYHIELISSFSEAHEWFEYTNPTADQRGNHFAGARWCIAEYEDHWNSYVHDKYNDNVTVYFCWKADSKEALLAMNDHVADYDVPGADQGDGTYEDQKNPFNEYGLSLICVMVQAGAERGDVRFLQATSRYNHCNGHGQRRFEDSVSKYYGDELCVEGGKSQICRILGMSEEEFNRTLVPQNNGGGVSHDAIKEVLDDPDEVFRHCDDVNYMQEFGIARIYQARQYNFYDTFTHKLLSPARWFDEADEFSSAGTAFVKSNNGKWNLFSRNGNMLIDVDVDKVSGRSSNYAKIGIKKNDESEYRYNIIRLDNGKPLLRRLYKDVKLANSYGSGIPVYDDDNKWKLLNIKGKVASTIPAGYNIALCTPKLLAINNGSSVKVIDKGTNRTLVSLDYGRCHDVLFDGIIIRNREGNYNVVTVNGLYFDEWMQGCNTGTAREDGYANFVSEPTMKVHYVNSDWTSFVIESSKMTSYKNGLIFCDDGNVYNTHGEKLELDGYDYVGDRWDDIVLLKHRDHANDMKFFNMKTNEFVNTGDHRIIRQSYTSHGIFIMDDNNKGNFVKLDGTLLLPEFIPNVERIGEVGSNCYLIEYPNKCNIYNSELGTMLFKMDFSHFRGRFNDQGIAIITCGNKEFYINADGDVSTHMELLENAHFRKVNSLMLG